MGRRSEHVCHGCGAPLPPAEPGTTRACSYCGRVAVASEQRGAFARPGAKKALLLGVGGSFLVAGALATWSFVMSGMVASSSSPPRSSAGAERDAAAEAAYQAEKAALEAAKEASRRAVEAAREPMRVGSHALLVARTDRPEEDLLVTLEPVGRDEVVLTLLAAGDGRERWRRVFEVEQAPLPLRAVVDRTLVVFTRDGRILGLDAERGTTLWAHAFAEEARELCGAGAIVGVRHASGVAAFTAATGEPAASPRTCTPIYGSSSPAPNFVYVEGAALASWLPDGHEFFLQRGLQPHRGAARVALGREPGEQGPITLGVLEGKRWRWRATLRAEAPAEAAFFGEPQAAVRNERVAVPYRDREGALHLASFDLDTGRRQWDREIAVSLPEDAEVEVLASISGHVFLRAGDGRSWVVEPHRGDVEWSIGPG